MFAILWYQDFSRIPQSLIREIKRGGIKQVIIKQLIIGENDLNLWEINHGVTVLTKWCLVHMHSCGPWWPYPQVF